MSIGIMVSINQRLDAETINLVAEESVSRRNMSVLKSPKR